LGGIAPLRSRLLLVLGRGCFDCLFGDVARAAWSYVSLFDAGDGEDAPARVGEEDLVGLEHVVDGEHAAIDLEARVDGPFEHCGSGDSREGGAGDGALAAHLVLLAAGDGGEEALVLDDECVADAGADEVVGDAEDECFAGVDAGGVAELSEAPPVVECFVGVCGVEGVGPGVGDSGGDAALEHLGWVFGGALGDDEECGVGCRSVRGVGMGAGAGAGEEVEVASGDGDADAGSRLGASSGRGDRGFADLLLGGMGEAELGGGGEEACDVAVEVVDVGFVFAGRGGHGLEEAYAVLEARVEWGDGAGGGFGRVEEVAVEPDGEHWGGYGWCGVIRLALGWGWVLVGKRDAAIQIDPGADGGVGGART